MTSPSPGSGESAVAGVGQLGLLAVALMKVVFTPLRAFATGKLAMFATLCFALLAGKVNAAWSGGQGRIQAEFPEMTTEQARVLAMTVVVLACLNLVAFLRAMRLKERYQEEAFRALRSKQVSDDIKRQILDGMK